MDLLTREELMELTKREFADINVEERLKEHLKKSSRYFGVDISEGQIIEKVKSLVYFASWNLKLDTGVGTIKANHARYPIYLYQEDFMRFKERINSSPPFKIENMMFDDSWIDISNYCEGIFFAVYPSPLRLSEIERDKRTIRECGLPYDYTTLSVIEDIDGFQVDHDSIRTLNPSVGSYSVERLRFLKKYTLDILSEVSISKKNVERLRKSSNKATACLKVYTEEGNNLGYFSLNGKNLADFASTDEI